MTSAISVSSVDRVAVYLAEVTSDTKHTGRKIACISICHTDRNNHFWNTPSREGRINKCSSDPDRCPHSWRLQAACPRDRFAAQPGYQANSRSQYMSCKMFPFHFKSDWACLLIRCVCRHATCVMLTMFEDGWFNMQISTKTCRITSKQS